MGGNGTAPSSYTKLRCTNRKVLSNTTARAMPARPRPAHGPCVRGATMGHARWLSSLAWIGTVCAIGCAGSPLPDARATPQPAALVEERGAPHEPSSPYPPWTPLPREPWTLGEG